MKPKDKLKQAIAYIILKCPDISDLELKYVLHYAEAWHVINYGRSISKLMYYQSDDVTTEDIVDLDLRKLSLSDIKAMDIALDDWLKYIRWDAFVGYQEYR